MNIAVLVKLVPDTEASIKLTPDKSWIETRDISWVLSPYDEYAIEEAVRIREKVGGTVKVLTMGPPQAETALRSAISVGAEPMMNALLKIGDRAEVFDLVEREMGRHLDAEPEADSAELVQALLDRIPEAAARPVIGGIILLMVGIQLFRRYATEGFDKMAASQQFADGCMVIHHQQAFRHRVLCSFLCRHGHQTVPLFPKKSRRACSALLCQ